MTNTTYIRLLAEARRQYPLLTQRATKQLQESYITAAKMAAAVVRDAETRGLSRLTVESWAQIKTQLERGAQLIQDAIEQRIPLTVGDALEKYTQINIDYIMGGVRKAGADKITEIGIRNMFVAINDRVIRSIANRVFRDGYSYSTRIWRVGQYYQEQIKRVINAGLAQGRDVIKIARDIQVYTKDGKIALAKRYGPNLERPTKAFMARIGNRVDYRALRLVRSELYMSLQDAGRESGRINPACAQEWDWILGPSRSHWDCECPDFAANAPYEYNEIPAYPHPNCVCEVRQVLRNHEEFMNDLASWSQGNTVPYLDDWYNNIYQYYA
jgi:hypothetical protein